LPKAGTRQLQQRSSHLPKLDSERGNSAVNL